MYECGDEYEFVVRSGRDEVSLYLPDDFRRLSRTRSAGGERYADAEVGLLLTGETASLDLGGKRYVDCRLDRERGPWEEARRRGVDFRAVGQEPGWVLEIQQDGNLLLIADYGASRLLARTPEPELIGEIERYTVEQKALVVEIRTEHCLDTMSGASYTHRVLVQAAGRTYRGCGLSLETRQF